jgi:hypothetical protein
VERDGLGHGEDGLFASQHAGDSPEALRCMRLS